MSTRARLGNVNPDGTVTSIYVHHDGDSLGNALSRFYNRPEDVEALLALGDLSGMEDDGTAVAYHRDLGEDDCPAIIDQNKADFFKTADGCDAEFAYLWEDAQWIRRDRSYIKHWRAQ